MIAGGLADNVFEPALRPGGALVDSLGGLLGTGTGAGIGLAVVIGGAISMLVGVLGFLIPAVREIELRMPDYDVKAGLQVDPLAAAEVPLAGPGD